MDNIQRKKLAEQKASIELMLGTVASPGWPLIVERAFARIGRVKTAALANRDEAKFLELYRRVHAAEDALREWTDPLQQILEDELAKIEGELKPNGDIRS